MGRVTSSYFWKTMFGVVTGSIVGILVSELTSGVAGLSWLSLGSTVGINPPFGVDLGFLAFTFGITLNINLAIVIFIVIFVLLFRKIF